MNSQLSSKVKEKLEEIPNKSQKKNRRNSEEQILVNDDIWSKSHSKYGKEKEPYMSMSHSQEFVFVDEKLTTLKTNASNSSNYVDDDSFIHRILVVKVPMSYINILILIIVGILSLIGCSHLFKLINQPRCHCRLCLGEYEITKKISEGGFSSVSLAQKVSTKENFVIKQIYMKEITEIDELQMEAKQLIKLNHQNIVSYEDDFIHLDQSGLELTYSYFIVMEYCNGGDLTDKIRQAVENNTSLTENQIMEWFCQLLLAVKYIHNKDIVHRDIKGPN